MQILLRNTRALSLTLLAIASLAIASSNAQGQFIREYIRAGGRVIAIENPAGSSGSGATNHVRDFAGNGRSGAIVYDPSNGQEYTLLSNGDGTFQSVPNLFTSG